MNPLLPKVALYLLPCIPAALYPISSLLDEAAWARFEKQRSEVAQRPDVPGTGHFVLPPELSFITPLAIAVNLPAVAVFAPVLMLLPSTNNSALRAGLPFIACYAFWLYLAHYWSVARSQPSSRRGQRPLFRLLLLITLLLLVIILVAFGILSFVALHGSGWFIGFGVAAWATLAAVYLVRQVAQWFRPA